MPISETWLLPDGVADVLPEQAQIIERLRRQALDFLAQRGYQLVYTPFIEYLESLSSLSALNHDLDLVTFKIIDQISGRLLGVRADMTPQVARIDAHVRPIAGVARYCYAGTILHTKPQGLTASRAPLQLGAELYGHDSLDADLEMIDTMLGVLAVAGYQQGLHLDLGHVGLFRSLVKLAGLSKDQELALSDLYQRKALPELKDYTAQLAFGADFYELGRLSGDLQSLITALSPQTLQDADFNYALDSLQTAIAQIQIRWPQVQVGIDVVELRSYHYHTGLMFAVYAPNHAMPLAQGGRYDGIGEHFGRARPATGFSCDLYKLVADQYKDVELIVAPAGREQQLQTEISTLREQGHHVIQLLGEDQLTSVPQATHQLRYTEQGWKVEKI
ncbi:ATP phosphoribosyltransferase regulatory subunit [Acinetobacter qingfengensis]|uniref:ATP phosphoribosyltransferase regulatory subunit n=1 Tax=Acinetobacter qingfengensis TaxID=1262585 RepID=A0A1E7R956_9GAMM|nr:ATP phosphoribosyltransferase regulatory subunit [Acinetobacter qingfengensis]KAA8735467.1 ATP phosphoribosyltransferase regulatory subunit [Acinetobacter qingfengensis]OEY95889.1 ATP phosphoribosyltransferase regulatory subunit [Acinetobacter qingfengensis]